MAKRTPAADGPAADLALPRPPGALQRWLERHPKTVDWTLAVLCQAPLLVIGLVLPATGTAGPIDVVWVLVVCVVGFVALILRRRFPLAGAIAVGLLPIAAAFLPTDMVTGGWADTFVLLYSLGVHTTTRRMWLGFGFVAVASVAAAFLSAAVDGDDALPAAIGTPIVIFYLVPTLIGLSVGNRRRYIAAIIARAEDLARERDQRARLAVTEERARVAREMHDIVSHGLTVMITLSEGAAARAESGAPGAPDAMRTVASAGRDALADMRRLLGLLRDPDAPAELAPQPSAADLDALVEGFREAGVPVRWTHSGPPLDGADDMRADIPLTAYRIIQEGLTNVLRHAPGASRVEVELDNAPDAVTITIENGRAAGGPESREAGPTAPTTPPRSGPASSPQPPTGARERIVGAGRGLIGVRERAGLHGGSADAGPTPTGGWRLHAVLPKGER
ncbi:sensor histidine kinase [Microbacterium halophytorum]|uniref:sensor histidine kinase n=1 Tax=Microbacterium halophytorum TaxID=2067568 RepID=UPI000CFCDCC4|nr:histidine kinase [Microbacterium halophytorum]